MNQKIRVLFDTNILVYAHDESATYHTDSAELLKLAIENQIQGILAEQNIIELYRILTNSVAMKGTPLTPLQTNNLINSIYLSPLLLNQV
jgi:predicted nucleic acid-binding protein